MLTGPTGITAKLLALGRGKSGLYHGVDEMQALVEARERALHRVNCHHSTSGQP